MKTLLQDVRYGLRMLWKNPGFMLVAVIALALGIGANTAIFSVVNAVLLRPLSYPNADQIVTVWNTDLREGGEKGSVAAQDFGDWQKQNNVFAQMSAYHYESFTLTGADQPERVSGARVTSGFTQVVGINPAAGRAFLPEEDEAEVRGRVAIISDRLWQRRFASDPQALGKTITLNSEPFTVIGIMPPDFKFPSSGVDVWTPANLNYVRQANTVNSFLSVVARLKPGVSLQQAQIEMETIARRLAEAHPDTNKHAGVRLVALHEQTVGKVRLSLLVLCGAVGMVLLIACANVANLFLARAAARRREIAVRTALGASRLRLIRQLLTESALLALAGGTMGLLLAVWGVDLLASAISANLPRAKEIGVDRQAFAFTLFVSLLTGFIFGLVPALQASKTELSVSLKEGSQSQTTSISQGRFRSSLVVAQVALALMLLIGAGLFLKSFQHLRQLDAGFEPRQVLTMQLSLPEAKYSEGRQQIQFFDQALARINALPGVRAVGVVTNLPLGHSKESSSFEVEGRAPASPDEKRQANASTISPDYFRAMDISVTNGRAFTERDRRETPGVVIINRALARRFFSDEDPIGKHLIVVGRQEREFYGKPIPREIVGITEDVRFELEREADPEMYMPYAQRPIEKMTLVVRTDGAPTGITTAVRGAVLEVDKDQPVYNIRTMEQWLTESVASHRLVMTLTSLFAGLALLLAGVGIYGVMAYTVAGRTHEIGIRVALGAQRRDVLRLIIGQGLRLAVLGVGLGLLGAFAATRVMASLLYGVSATDPLIFFGVAVLLAGVALLACYIPARRATKVDPMIALRYE
ncbi:MAG: ABC transporter permease [Pyrinomonadaceae bacterium]